VFWASSLSVEVNTLDVLRGVNVEVWSLGEIIPLNFNILSNFLKNNVHLVWLHNYARISLKIHRDLQDLLVNMIFFPFVLCTLPPPEPTYFKFFGLLFI
jgi:hypothetical protein